MKRFADFKVKPVVVTALPVHGKHASKKDLNESSISTIPTNIMDETIHEHDNKHLGETPTHVAQKLRNPDLPKMKGFGGLKSYTEYSRTINQHLIHEAAGRHGSVFDSDEYGHLSDSDKRSFELGTKRRVANLDKFIDSHPRTEHDLTVYHGTGRWHPGLESSKHPEGHVHLPGYTSTSLDKRKANSFAGGESGYHSDSGSHILQIHVPKGHKGVYVGSHSHHKDEKEFLLPRGMKVKIHPNPTTMTHTVHRYSPDKKAYEPVEKKVHVWKATPV